MRISPKGLSQVSYLKELVEYLDVFFLLALRDVRLRYRQTLLGVVWVILQALLPSLIFALILGHFSHLPSQGLPYLLFALSGFLPWTLFSQGLQRASLSLLLDERLITKVYFPRVLIPFSSCCGVLVDFFITALLLLMFMLGYGIYPSIALLAFLPIACVTLIFTCGVSLFFAGLNVYYRDFKHICPFLLQIWMYASPIAYSAQMIPSKWQWIYDLNPLSGMIAAYRWTFFPVSSFPWQSFSYTIACSIAFFLLGLFVFRKVENHFADLI